MGIQVERVTVKNRANREAAILQEITCTIEQGITLLVGQTGSGKSTLLDVLSGLTVPDGGAVSYDRRPLWTGKKINRDVLMEIGAVFQYPEHQLFARTVEAEFAYSLRPWKLSAEEVRERAITGLADMGLGDEILSRSPLVLSGGQKRRVALGTTFATQPVWLFLDEPTAGLDPQAVQRFCEHLRAWQEQRGGGVLIATHDLDALFPLADRVLVLSDGRVVANMTPAELCREPHILQQARIGLPSSAQIAQGLGELGLEVNAGPVAPQELAKQIAEQLMRAKGNMGSEPSVEKVETAHLAEMRQMDHTSQQAQETRVSRSAAVQSMQPGPSGADTIADEQSAVPVLTESSIRALDPRAKWLYTLLLSIGILLQNNWTGLLVASGVTVLSIWLSRVSLRELYQLTRPFLFFILLSAVLSGLRFSDLEQTWHIGGIGFSTADAGKTFLQVYKILLVMLIALLLPATTSQLRLKRGLEQSLAPLARLKLPTEAFALATSLLLRFLPVIMQELGRISRITRARGKSTAPAGAVRLRDVRSVTIPLLLSILQLGEDLSLAMESRGYSRMGQARTSSIHLRMQRPDVLLILFAALQTAVLLFFR